MHGTGIGMTYDKTQDVADDPRPGGRPRRRRDGEDGAIGRRRPATATFARRDKIVRFERGVQVLRGGQIIEADSGVAHLSDDEKRVDSVELRGNARITATEARRRRPAGADRRATST